MSASITEWGRARVDDLVALCDATMPDEQLTRDELEACCYDDEGVVVLGVDDGAGAVVACVRAFAGFVKLLAVVPSAQGLGLGRRLLDAAVTWLAERHAPTVLLGGSAPFYLWPGVDVRMTKMLALAESAGFTPVGAELNMVAPTTFRAGVPDGIVVRRVLDDRDAATVVQCCGSTWPQWEAEVRRGIEHGACIGAWDAHGGRAVGFACHSVNRAGWVGPIATDPAWQRRGIAAALMGEVCRDLSVAGCRTAEIAWVGPVGFYAKAMGARVSRTFRTYSLRC